MSLTIPTSFLKDFDSLLENMLSQFQALSPEPDTTQLSQPYIKSACIASMLWGLYKYQDWIADQILPTTMDGANLDGFGGVYGITRNSGESDSSYLARILSNLRQPPAGGTANDYYNWALQTPATPANVSESFLPAAVNTISNIITTEQTWETSVPVKFTTTGTLPAPLVAGTVYYTKIVDIYDDPAFSLSAGGATIDLTSAGTGTHTIIPQATTLYTVADAAIITPPLVTFGSVTIVITPNDLSIIGTQAGTALATACQKYVDTLRPVTASYTAAVCVSNYSVNVTITVNPITADTAKIGAAITNYLNGFKPGQELYISNLIAIAINSGATNAVINTPSASVISTISQKIKPGTVNIITSN